MCDDWARLGVSLPFTGEEMWIIWKPGGRSSTRKMASLSGMLWKVRDGYVIRTFFSGEVGWKGKNNSRREGEVDKSAGKSKQACYDKAVTDLF